MMKLLVLAASLTVGSDTVTMEQTGADRYVFTYSNSRVRGSFPGTYIITENDVEVWFSVDIGDEERVMIQPPEGWVAVPEEIRVKDGESLDVLIVRPMM